MGAVDQSRINFSRRMGSRRPSNAVPGCQHLGNRQTVKKPLSVILSRHHRGRAWTFMPADLAGQDAQRLRICGRILGGGNRPYIKEIIRI
eukprot:scaffold4315_cov60-Phaeocystis_antarctica.AAC.1